jgi:hypothetical protein
MFIFPIIAARRPSEGRKKRRYRAFGCSKPRIFPFCRCKIAKRHSNQAARPVQNP